MLLLVVRVIGSFKLFCLIAFPLCKSLCLEDTVSQINQLCRCVCVCVCVYKRDNWGRREFLKLDSLYSHSVTYLSAFPLTMC